VFPGRQLPTRTPFLSSSRTLLALAAAHRDDVLSEDVWNRPELPAGDRSLITVAVLTAGGNTEQLGFHLRQAIENGVTQEELIEAITHVTLYACWPKGMAAMGVAKQLFTGN
jgi:4-carboxymuconolactone decarboxylase